MKKQIILAAMLVMAAGSSAFAQGYFNFSTGGKFVWDDYTTPAGNAVVAPGNVNVAFLWATTNNSPVAGIGAVGNPTNGPSLSLAGDPWGAILTNGDNFTLAQDSSSGLIATIPNIASGFTKGGIAYNAGNAFQVAGTVSGGIYEIFIIGWSSAYADPIAAAAANAPVGWGNTFIYLSGSTSSTIPSGQPLASFSASGAGAFGVSPVPEPTTFALAGLGAAALLIFRRRKQ
jgi:PEP-CTERM putative exosortase interaction domain